MIHRLLVPTSLLCCAVVAISFALWAGDQASGASDHQQAMLAGLSTAHPAAPRHAPEPQPRRLIDGAAHALTSPFAGIVQSDNAWVGHAVPAALALIVYGVGLRFLARWSAGQA